MKTQNWIDGTAFVGGLAIAAAIWAGVHGADGGGFGGDKQLIQAENVAVSDSGQAGSQREGDQSSGTSRLSGQAHDWTAAIEAAPRPYRPITSLSKSPVIPSNPSTQSNPRNVESQSDSTTAPANRDGQPDSTTATARRNGQPDSTTAQTNRNGQPNPATAPAQRNDQPKQSTPPAKHPDRAAIQPSAEAPKLSVRVYLSDSRRVERVALEQYVRGVLAAEMPTDFEPAALQAQALAARTYIVRRLLHEDRSGVPTNKADVTDTQTHQVYRSKAEMDKLRQSDEKAWQAVDDAVTSTQGLVIAYDGEPIDALYFSSSNGYTENSEDVFGFSLPYLRSVDSPWDRYNAPRSADTVTLPLDQFYDKLGIHDLPTTGQQEKSAPTIAVQSRTTGKRIRTLAIGDTTLSGVQARDKLGLRSADFIWQISKDTIAITTRGSGHGVGMSQWGAQGMALAGYSANEIISHYYSGTKLVKVSQFL